MVFPTLALHRMPMPQLISELRTALKEIYTKGKEMEERWVREALAQGVKGDERCRETRGAQRVRAWERDTMPARQW